MAKVTTDSAGKLELYFRVARASVPKTLTFKDVNGNAYSIAGITFLLNFIDPNTGSTVLSLASGTGLTIGSSSITFSLTEVQSALPKDLYYWELYDSTNKRSWIYDKSYFIKREPPDIDNETELTVKLTGETINVTVTTGSGSGGEGITEVDGGTI